MRKNIFLLILSNILASFLYGQNANIEYGSFTGLGGSLFQGVDGLSVDSIAIGYFTGSANINLSGWNPLANSTTFQTSTGFSSNTALNVDVSSGLGSEAWLLVSDNSFSGLIRADDWTTITGSTSPAPTTNLLYQLGPSNTVSNSVFLGDIVVFDNAGQGGSGLLVQVVPEPSTYALFAGVLILGYSIFRRFRANV